MVKHKSAILSYATRGFRDSADRDYISAREIWRLNFHHQYLWLGAQCIEKYLKSILLFNIKPAKESHAICKLYDKVVDIKELSVDFTNEDQKVVSLFDKYQHCRYDESYIETSGLTLLHLDKTVWSLRRYCQNINITIDGVSLLAPTLEQLQCSYYKDNPHRFRIIGGFLEQVIDGRLGHRARSALIWKNFYFGKRKKKIIKNFESKMMSSFPVFELHPESIEEMKKYIKVPRQITK